jgi:glutamine---fructose-6-phosphate transaminase (isomerizing)
MEHKSKGEIFGQGESLRRTIDLVLSRREEIRGFFNEGGWEEIVFIGCGSSHWLSLSAAATATSVLGVPCRAVKSGDIVMNRGMYQKAFRKPLVVAPSRSGSTSETLAAIDFMKDRYGSRVLTLTEYPGSPFRAAADLSLELPWANEESVCQTRSFSSLYLGCVAVACVAGAEEGLLRDLARYADDAMHLGERINEEAARLVRGFPAVRDLTSLGNGPQYGVCIEGAYIGIEMAGFPGSYFGTLEYRHGPIVMADARSLVFITIGREDRTYDEGIAREARKRGARVAVILDEGGFECADYRFELGRAASAEAVALFAALVMQGFAYHKAVHLGVDPDNPPGLIPWIKM